MIILSFDVATKTLGYSVVLLDDQIFDYLTPKYYSNLTKRNKIYNIPPISYLKSLDYIEILESNVVNLLDKNDTVKNSRSISKARNLKKLTTRLIDQYDIGRVYIENQPAKSVPNIRIMENLKMEFCEFDLHIIGSSLKNKIYYHDNLMHQEFCTKYKTNYTANKNHSKENFIFACNYLQSDVIQNLDSVNRKKSKKIDDVADAFNQIIGALFFHIH